MLICRIGKLFPLMNFDFMSIQLEQRYLEKRVKEHKTISHPLRTKTLRQEMKVCGTLCVQIFI